MNVVVAYARVSSETQAQQETVGSQVAALLTRAKADGHSILPDDIFIDNGYSGTTLVRPALERLRDRLAQGGVDRLYVYAPDRLARRYAYQVLLVEEFTNCGAEVVFLCGRESNNPEDNLLLQVQGIISEYERAKILERFRRGRLHKARNGDVSVLTGAPYGYNYVRSEKGEPARFEVFLPEARVVRQIFTWYVNEQVSLREIVRRLESEQVSTRRGRTRWDISTLGGLLRNPAYMGLAAYGRTKAVDRVPQLRPKRGQGTIPHAPKRSVRNKDPEEWVRISVPALVSEDTFAAAQEQNVRNQARAQRRAGSGRYLLQGLVVCAHCRYSLYGRRSSAWNGRKVYSYYRCSGRDGARFSGGAVCDNPEFRAEQLEEYVWASVCALLKDPERLENEWRRRCEQPEGFGEQKEAAVRRLEAHRRALERLVDAYEAGVLELAELRVRTGRVRSMMDAAEREVRDLDARSAQDAELRGIVAQLNDFAERVSLRLDELDWPERQRVVRALVARVEVARDRVTVVYRVAPPAAPPNTGAAASPGHAEFCRLRARVS